MQEHLEKCADATSQRIDSFVDQEKEPFTSNEHLYMEYRSNFLAHYKGARLREKSDFMKNLESSDDRGMKEAMKEAITALTKLGLEKANASSLAKLLPPDPMEPAIGIMADVRAYFQGAWDIFSLISIMLTRLRITLQWHTNGLWTMSQCVLIERCCTG